LIDRIRGCCRDRNPRRLRHSCFHDRTNITGTRDDLRYDGWERNNNEAPKMLVFIPTPAGDWLRCKTAFHAAL
jgi:hypothetical protein